MKKRTAVPTLAWSAKTPWRPTPLSLFILITTLGVCGIGESLIIQSQLGAAPWTVLALGVNHFTPFSLGLTTFCISVVVLLLWLPLGLKMGLGTLMNALIIATTLHLTPYPAHLACSRQPCHAVDISTGRHCPTWRGDVLLSDLSYGRRS